MSKIDFFSEFELKNPEFWRNLCPFLSIKNDFFFEKSEKNQKIDFPAQKIQKQIVEEGYASLENAKIPGKLIQKLAVGIDFLKKKGLPPSFISLYDESWEVLYFMQFYFLKISKNNLFLNFDIVSWHVDPKKNEKGFSPHRDRQPQDWMPRKIGKNIENTFLKFEKNDKNENQKTGAAGIEPGTFCEFSEKVLFPKYATCWLALTEANPRKNSCLFFLPASVDPGYFSGDLDSIDPLSRAFSKKEIFQEIRCLPLPPGGCAFHSHRALHWGSSCPKIEGNNTGKMEKNQEKNGENEEKIVKNEGEMGVNEGNLEAIYAESFSGDFFPRIALSCAFSEQNFEKSYLKNLEKYFIFSEKNPKKSGKSSDFLRFSVPFELRLALACGQIINYGDRFLNDLSPNFLRISKNIFFGKKSEFSEDYILEIQKKYFHLSGEFENEKLEDEALEDLLGAEKKKNKNKIGKKIGKKIEKKGGIIKKIDRNALKNEKKNRKKMKNSKKLESFLEDDFEHEMEDFVDSDF